MERATRTNADNVIRMEIVVFTIQIHLTTLKNYYLFILNFKLTYRKKEARSKHQHQSTKSRR